jgi:LPS O-antigen subunit length determinant protein (WzzB/FepE family)
MNSQQPENNYPACADDEIDLVDLFLVLWRRKVMIVLFTLVCLLVGGLYAFTQTQTFRYVTALEIGTIFDGSGAQSGKTLVESLDVVKIKLDEVYIPGAVRQLSTEESDSPRLKAEAKAQKDSNIVLLSSVGAIENQASIAALHTETTSPLIENHNRMVAAAMQEYKLKAERAKLELRELNDPDIYLFDEKVLKGDIEKAKAQLDELDNQKELLKAQKKRLQTTQEILKQQVEKTEKQLKAAYANIPDATNEATDEPKALTFLMLNSQIEQNERRLADLQERLQVETENEKQLFDNKLSSNLSDIELQKAKVNELQSKLSKLRAERKSEISKQQNAIADAESKLELYQYTKTLGIAQRSLDPEGPRKALILALAGVLGLMGGIFLAFGAEFMVKVRRQQAEMEG